MAPGPVRAWKPWTKSMPHAPVLPFFAIFKRDVWEGRWNVDVSGGVKPRGTTKPGALPLIQAVSLVNESVDLNAAVLHHAEGRGLLPALAHQDAVHRPRVDEVAQHVTHRVGRHVNHHVRDEHVGDAVAWEGDVAVPCIEAGGDAREGLLGLDVVDPELHPERVDEGLPAGHQIQAHQLKRRRLAHVPAKEAFKGDKLVAWASADG
mmetsp:Transcript_11660/g.27357  ORF Transcript_11660/g.27357 Transcript_11660/m.27357 type:complete len:206 (-) Transcript_11660:234-851(-)|eukprot:CAMPEP_0172631422 /NCGR_PEP_ID=MMETSP1068-20121228/179079_1 /TAXON_ID=35684 /ORGANISM="Pseudopedinella elastica, Strain CCMP716" /LENGTH=205 /DNA_ID=CAMNT_0013442559 /DNA_START=137 /DNA_END=754 /DNA_ORIENTATION=+